MNTVIDIQRASTARDIPDDKYFCTWINACLEHHTGATDKTASPEVSIRLVDNEEIQQLNAQYRDKDQATNVLSFPASFPEGFEIALLGDIVMCAPYIAEEAKKLDKPLIAHWAHITIHGMLHLLGYDHINDNDAEQMETLETDILTGLGYPEPYARTA